MIAIVPARKGSKRLPGKNIKLLNGKPLIAYSIESALQSALIEEVIVSTDCDNIASIAKEYGAKVPFLRPINVSGDTTTMCETVKYTVDRLNKSRQNKIKEFILLQPTSPLRKSFHINEAIRLFYEKKANTVIGVVESKYPLEWAVQIDENKTLVPIKGNKICNHQACRSVYFPNGAIYVFSYDFFCGGDYYGPRTFPYVMQRCFSVDIDSIDDFSYAQFLLSKKGGM